MALRWLSDKIIYIFQRIFFLCKPYLIELLVFLYWFCRYFFYKSKKFFVIPREWKWYYKLSWRFLNFFVAFFFLLFIVDINLFWLFGKSPRIGTLYKPDMKLTSELYSADGKLLARYFDENRQPLKFEEIPPDFIKALIATEDARFYTHLGIDLKASLSVFYYMAKGEKRGGSTLTQQLVKNLFKTRSDYSTGLLGMIPGLQTLLYKTKEWTAALKLELFYSKNEILTLYCNTVDLGNRSFGLKTAAKTYFNKNPEDLHAEDYALLIGMLKAPSYYSPVNFPERALERRNVVFGQMLKAALIDQHAQDSLSALPLKITLSTLEPGEDESNYVRDAVSSYLKPWLKENGIDLYADGLKIYCTIDSRLQEYADLAVKNHMKRQQKRFYQHWQGSNPWSDKSGVEIPGYIENIARDTRFFHGLQKKYKDSVDSINYYLNLPHKMRVFTWNGDEDTTLSFMDSIRFYQHFLHAGFVVMDPGNGFVKAWVGGINHKHFKFDHVAQSKRQPGSTFKAFVYTAAIDNGYAPCDTKIDQAVTINYMENGEKMSWSPKNADWTFSGREVTLKHGFARSINAIAVQLTKEIGWKKVIEYAHKMGIQTELQDVPSVCLGSSDVSLLELVDAYCTIVNGGYKTDPVLVTRIEDMNGKVIYENHEKKVEALSPETAFYMQQMLLAGLTEPGGTTQALWEYKIFNHNTDYGGKTGTSSNHSDGWFVGVTPHLVGGAWSGGESRSIHFKTSELGEGCKTALPIFGLFMEKVMADENFKDLRVRFPKPDFKPKKNYTCHTVLPKNDSVVGDSIAGD